ncbi:MAG: hypothetical protein ACI8P3_001751 [Saprospiraceae bacterium]|jgi:hypothetical protein
MSQWCRHSPLQIPKFVSLINFQVLKILLDGLLDIDERFFNHPKRNILIKYKFH